MSHLQEARGAGTCQSWWTRQGSSRRMLPSENFGHLRNPDFKMA